jgi:hypothetical protein
MPTKLTLRLDERIIEDAKKYAKHSGKSVSRIVADLFEFIRTERAGAATKELPSTQSLRGVLKGKPVSEQDYRDHLESRYS